MIGLLEVLTVDKQIEGQRMDDGRQTCFYDLAVDFSRTAMMTALLRWHNFFESL